MDKSLDRLGQRVVASCWLNADVGEMAVQWAKRLPKNGCKMDSVAYLSYESAPFYWLEIKSRVNTVAGDLGMVWPDDEKTARRFLAKTYVEELVENGGNDDATLHILKQMYVDFDLDDLLFDFYSIWLGIQDLRQDQYQYYWGGLTLINFHEVVLDAAKRWLADYGGE